MELMRCENVSFAYEGRNILENLSFSLKRGELLAIVGENGSGKTTLVKGILGLKKPSAGKILFHEDFQRSEIGYLAQSSNIQREFPAKAFEVVLSGRLNSLGFRAFYSKKDKSIALENMRKLNVEKLRNEAFSGLSGGQRQRVLLARALCATENMLILDEPEASLDPIVTKELMEIVRNIKDETDVSIVMVSHNLKNSVNIADKVLHLNGGDSFFGDVEDYKKSDIGKKFTGGDESVQLDR